MPRYVYQRTDAEGVHVTYQTFSYEKRPKSIVVDGKKYHLACQAVYATEIRGGCHGYPYWSDVMSYHPDQIGEAQEFYRKSGLGDQEFNSMGDVLVRDSTHRKRLLKAHGYVDRNSYLGY